MIRSLCYVPNQPLVEDLPIEDYAAILKNPKALLWIDFDNEPDASTEPILTGIFGFHPLAVEDRGHAQGDRFQCAAREYLSSTAASGSGGF